MRLDQANWAADFDGDGFGDILGTAREGEDRSRPCVLWGAARPRAGEGAGSVAGGDGRRGRRRRRR
ncbi:hypothetical protein ACFSTC_53435 [Nonomuraea ferruginea]